MQLRHMYWYFESALTKDQCDKIIEIGENELSYRSEQGESIDAKTFEGNDKGTQAKKNPDAVSLGDMTITEAMDKGIPMEKLIDRDVHVSWIDDPLIANTISSYVNEANKSAGWNFDINYNEIMQFGRYGKDQFHGWHPDFGYSPYGPYWDVKNPPSGEPFQEVTIDGEVEYHPIIGLEAAEKNMTWHRNPRFAGQIRKLSVTVNLSDPNEYTGGNLRFDCGPHRSNGRFFTCEEIRPRGSIVVFPSHVVHQVTPITSGTRRSLVMWSLGPPFR
mgnify:FL=1